MGNDLHIAGQVFTAPPTPNQLAEFSAQAKSGEITGASLEWFLRGGGKQANLLRPFLADRRLTIGACDGSETLAKASDVFVKIDPAFKRRNIARSGPATRETPIFVFTWARNASMVRAFDSLTFDSRQLCFTQAQIKAFARKYLRLFFQKNGQNIHFLFSSNDHFFVATVTFSVVEGGLGVYMCPFEQSGIKDAKYRPRLVVPQPI